MDKQQIRAKKFKFRNPKNRYERGWNDALDSFTYNSNKGNKESEKQ